MPPSTDEAFDPETWSVATGPVPVPPANPRTTSELEADPQPQPDPQRLEIADLRRSLDQVSTQLEHTHQELVSARNQLGAARARTLELEHHLHTRIVEVTELRNQVKALAEPRQPAPAQPGPTVGRPVPPGGEPTR